MGDALFDCISDTNGASLEEMLEKGAWTSWPGGAPANVATALSKLGSSSGFAGCIGADQDGDVLATLFRDTGVDVSLLQRSSELPTRRVMVTRDPTGDRTFACFADGRPADAFADSLFDSQGLSSEALEAGLQGVRWMVCSTLSLAFPASNAAMLEVIDAGLARGARLYVDINWRDVFWPPGAEDLAKGEIMDLASKADVVKLTEEEAEWLFGDRGVTGDSAFAKPESVHAFFPKAKAVLVTAGGAGVAYSILGWTAQVPGFKVDVVETTGAGDAFTAGFMHGLLAMDLDFDMFNTLVPKEQRNLLLQYLVTFAAAVGALTCTGKGAIEPQPDYDQVEAFLAKRELGPLPAAP